MFCLDNAPGPDDTVIVQVAELQAAAQLLETSDAPLVPTVPLEQDDTSLTRFFAACVLL